MLKISNARLLNFFHTQLRDCKKWYSVRTDSHKTNISIEKLDRHLLKVSGKEASNFLQVLMTNDMRHLEEGANSMYAVFLNLQGRIMYDTIIYRTQEDNSFLIECDSSCSLALQKHLKMYRVRKKIDIDILHDHNVWVLFESNVSRNVEKVSDSDHSTIVPPNINEIKAACNKLNINLFRDPRLADLGYRAIASNSVDMEKDLKFQDDENNDSDSTYRALRYRLGIAEGSVELPPAKCFPLEANCEYLHGVSFHKGCYIGQELTARIHHTGVIRKRIMPIVFETLPSEKLSPDTPVQVTDSTKKIVGKLRGLDKGLGLGLLRISEALKAPKLHVCDYSCTTLKPTWWPQEAPREVKN